MVRVVVAYHSGYGHTKKLAEAVGDGAGSVPGAVARLLAVEDIDAQGWQALEAADAIVFGAPTYMGGPSAQFKVFADASAKAWFSGLWRDKVAGGFTCSLSMSGDKFSTLSYLATLAMQHGMIWVGTGTMPAQQPGAPEAINRLGGYFGVMAQADNVSPELSPPKGDLESARGYGQRVAKLAKALRG
ncbi:MAG TPA: flavodoxin family protein [Quisquiliibacterium sp.]|nr:flavodoxin family protein [Quisquiliibacterium sp.]